MIKASTKLIRDNNILTSDMDGETVMMSIENGEYYSLSNIGTKIWEILEVETTFENLVNKLMEMFNVEKELCESDTLEFLKDMISKKLIIINK